MVWLNGEDFNNLDDLIGKLGFGGYFDFLECLNTISYDLAKILNIEVDRQKNITDAYHNIRGLVNLLIKKGKK